MIKPTAPKLPTSHYWRQLGLQSDPFPADLANQPFITEKRQQYLDFLLMQKKSPNNLVLVIGNSGVGKTFLLTQLKEHFQYKLNVLSINATAELSTTQLSKLLQQEFHLTPQSILAENALQQQIALLLQSNEQYLLLIDNAEKLSAELQAACLSIVESQANKKYGLNIILFAQLTLVKQLEKIIQQQHNLAAHDIIKIISIEPLSKTEVENFIKSRLQASAYDGSVTLFTKHDIEQIYVDSAGLPQKILPAARAHLISLLTPRTKSFASAINLNKDLLVKGRWWISVLIIIAILLLVVLPWLQKHNLGQADLNLKLAQPVAATANPIKATAAPAPIPTSTNKATVQTAKPLPTSASNATAQAVNSLLSNNLPQGSRLVVNGQVTTVNQSVKTASSTAAFANPVKPTTDETPPSTNKLSNKPPKSTLSALEDREQNLMNAQLKELPAIEHGAAMPNANTVNNPLSLTSDSGFRDTAKRLLKIDGSMYTLQLFVSTDPSSVRSFTEYNNISDLAAVYQTMRHNQLVYIVILGYFPSAKEAQQAVGNLDPALQKLHPWPRSFGSVHEDIKLMAADNSVAE